MMARLLLALFLLAFARPAGAVDVSQLSDFEADPCVMAIGERNTAQHVDAPDSALADACERAHGNVEVAWDFLTRLWQPRDVLRSAGAAAAPLGAAGAAVAVLQMVLVYPVLGAPVWALAVALRPARGPVPPKRSIVEAGGSLLVRLLLGTVLLAILTLPGTRVVAALAVLATLAFATRPAARRTSAGNVTEATGFATVLAGIINDTAAAAPGALALALVARGNWRLLALGVLVSILASLPPVRRMRRTFAGTPVAGVGGAVLLAVSVGWLALTDPALASLASSMTMALLVPTVFAAIVMWRSPLLDRFIPKRQFSGG